MNNFDTLRPLLETEFDRLRFEGPSPELQVECERLRREYVGEERILIRARLFRLICEKGRIAEGVNPFVRRLDPAEILPSLRDEWLREAWKREFGTEEQRGWVVDIPGHGCHYCIDTSHTAPDWEAILALGLPGLRDRAERGGDTPFHRAATMACEGAIAFCRRSADVDLRKLAERPPETLVEAFHLAKVWHDLQELEGEQVRTMGWFDRLYLDFYRRDLAAGRLTRDSAKELLKFFWIAFYAEHQGKAYGKNFCFGPETNELSQLALETYHELNLVDPKLSILVGDGTAPEFLELCARNIRDGRTAIVFLNYPLVVEGLLRHGRAPEDARRCLPVGCYEPAVAGHEVSCSGATHFYLPQILCLLLDDGREFNSFEELFAAYLDRIRRELEFMEEQQRRCEKLWPEVNPSPFFSAGYADCILSGRDITEGGMKYNSTACVISYLPEAADALAALDYLVYREKLCTLAELRTALQADWKGFERLQQTAKTRAPKWGNNDQQVDSLALRIADFAAKQINHTPNARGGFFYASLYGQKVVEHGKLIGALPNGRNAGQPVSKNLDACIGMDRKGITALTASVVKLDLADFPCGTCLDLMLHPSTVRGEEGIGVLTGIIRTFLARGGSGLQFNLFDAAELREAQRTPEKYAHLQVRVCGWNVHFTDLAPEAQQTFIDQAEALA